MHRSIRNVLGLAAASAVIAVGLPALATSASAATATKTASASSYDFDDDWGYYYSKYFNGSRAKARGTVYEDEDGDFHVEGRLYDKSSPGWLCGYVQVKFENEDGDDSTYWAKKCGSSGSRYFHFSSDDVDNISVRVCYWDNHHAAKKYCGRWNYVYESDGDE